MRKDVKFGLVIGGILLAVLVVYTLIVPSNSDDVAIENAVPEYHDAVADGGEIDVTDVATPDAGTDNNAIARHETVRVTETPVAARAPTVTETPVQPTSDKWSTALSEGTIPLMGTDTARPAGARTPAPSATPSDVADLPPLNSAEEEPSSAVPPADAAVNSGPIANAGTGPIASAPTPRTHTVKSSETLSSIARDYYGAASYYPHILRANPSVDPNRLRVGTVLNIPDRAVVVSRDSTTSNNAVSPNAPLAGNQYRVASGDTLEKIAVKTLSDGRRWQEIYDLNRQTIGNDPAKLKIGQVLQIPGASR